MTFKPFQVNGKQYLINRFGEIRKEKCGSLIRPYVHKGRGSLYLRVTLNGKKFLVHKLNWEVHNGPVPEGHQVDHNDRNTFNNDIATNLKLKTVAENLANRRKYNAHKIGVK